MSNDSYKPVLFQSLNKSILLDLTHRDLVIFAANNTSIFSNLFGQRRRANTEYWLLDITNYNSTTEAFSVLSHNLENLSFDDDLYLYWEIEDKIELWEIYKIHKDVGTKILQYGHWSKEFGLEVVKESKWRRRKDLQVRIQFFPFCLYISSYNACQMIFRDFYLE